MSAELLRHYTEDGSFAVIARWSSPDAYSAWQSISTTEAPREALKKLGQALEGMTPGAIWSSVQFAGPAKPHGSGSGLANPSATRGRDRTSACRESVCQ